MENDLMKAREEILNYLQKMIVSSENNAKGLRSMKARGFSQEGMLDKVIEVTAIQSDQIKTLAMVALAYAKSFEFVKNLGIAMVAEHEEDKKKGV